MSGDPQLFGAASLNGVRHAAYPSVVLGHSNALCDFSLRLAWCEPLQTGQKVCQRPTCKRLADEARAASNPDKEEAR